MDLLLPEVPRKGSIRPADIPKLEIKRDAKGLVSVLGATNQAVTSAAQLMATVEQVCSGLLGSLVWGSPLPLSSLSLSANQSQRSSGTSALPGLFVTANEQFAAAACPGAMKEVPMLCSVKLRLVATRCAALLVCLLVRAGLGQASHSQHQHEP